MGCAPSHPMRSGAQEPSLVVEGERGNLLKAAMLLSTGEFARQCSLSKALHLLANASAQPENLTEWLCSMLNTLQPETDGSNRPALPESRPGPSGHDSSAYQSFSPSEIQALSDRATRAEDEAKRLNRVLAWTEKLRQSEHEKLNAYRSGRKSRGRDLALFSLTSPIETAIASLRALAESDERAAPSIQEAIQVIEKNARFSVDVREELDKLEETGKEIDVGLRAYLMETMESTDLVMPNWANSSTSAQNRFTDLAEPISTSFTKKSPAPAMPPIKGRQLSQSTLRLFRSNDSPPSPAVSVDVLLLSQQSPLQGVQLGWDFDVVKFDAERTGRGLSFLFIHLLDEYNLVSSLQLDRSKLVAFIGAIEKHYGDNPYHSKVHGADVLLGMSLFIKPYRELLQPWQQFAALFAAACHDFEHPGTTNAHEVKVSSQRAIRHHDESVLECHHLERMFTRLIEPRYNFLSKCSRETYVDIRKLVIVLVLQTDLSKHFDFISRIQSMSENSLKLKLDRALDIALAGERASEVDDLATPTSHPSPPKSLSMSSIRKKSSDRLSLKDKDADKRGSIVELFLTAGIKFCDLGHSIKPWEQHERWSLAVTKEFYLLGDFERSIGVPISPLCDRETDTNLSKSQRGFLEFVVMPFYNNVNRILPLHDWAVENLRNNFQRWENYPGRSQVSPVETP
ncbi:hypothetical protein AB1Y20_004352 [Prymnesium parvum]|uniref:PDEase domain-containing protein n=1 Tax=Prymnesium parvum TaxID=97485 RepID=A0AB34J014_PRYPA